MGTVLPSHAERFCRWPEFFFWWAGLAAGFATQLRLFGRLQVPEAAQRIGEVFTTVAEAALVQFATRDVDDAERITMRGTGG